MPDPKLGRKIAEGLSRKTELEEKEKAVDKFSRLPGVTPAMARAMYDAGLRTYQDLLSADEDLLLTIFDANQQAVDALRVAIVNETQKAQPNDGQMDDLDLELETGEVKKATAESERQKPKPSPRESLFIDSVLKTPPMDKETEAALDDLDKELGEDELGIEVPKTKPAAPEAPHPRKPEPAPKPVPGPAPPGKPLDKEAGFLKSLLESAKAPKDDSSRMDRETAAELDELEKDLGVGGEPPQKRVPTDKPFVPPKARPAPPAEAPARPAISKEDEDDLLDIERELEGTPVGGKIPEKIDSDTEAELEDLEKFLQTVSEKKEKPAPAAPREPVSAPAMTPKPYVPKKAASPLDAIFREAASAAGLPQKEPGGVLQRARKKIQCRRCGSAQIDFERARCADCRNVLPYDEFKKAYDTKTPDKARAVFKRWQHAIVYADITDEVVHKLTAIDEKIEATPEDSRLHYRRAMLLSESNKLEDAVEGLDAALKTRPSYKNALLAKADILARLGNQLESQNCLKRAAILPDEPEEIDIEEMQQAQELEQEAVQVQEQAEAIDELEALEAELGGAPSRRVAPKEKEVAPGDASAEIDERQQLERLVGSKPKARFTGTLTKTGGIEGSIDNIPVKGSIDNFIAPKAGKINGIVNGRGRINGLINGSRKFIGLVNGRGRVNGLINGNRVTGRINGIINGKKTFAGMINGSGRINGLVNGRRLRGKINGLQGAGGKLEATIDGRASMDGVINGTRRVRGLINGRGQVNGLVNGKRVTGHINGLQKSSGKVNGVVVRDEAAGRVNGLHDGYGRTNGIAGYPTSLASSYIVRRHRSRLRMELAATAIVLAAMVLATLYVYQPTAQETYRISVDGNSGDWSGLPVYGQQGPAVPDSVSITEYSVSEDRGVYFFLLKVKGMALEGGPEPDNLTDSYIILIDSDKNAATGYRLKSSGADYMVLIYGRAGKAVSSSIMVYDNNADAAGLRWSAWKPLAAARTSVSGSVLEAQVHSSSMGLRQGTSIRAQFAALSWNGQSVVSESLASSEPGVLLAAQSHPPGYAFSAAEVPVLTVSLKALGQPMSVSSVEFNLLGTATPSKILVGGAAAEIDGKKAVLSYASPLVTAKDSVAQLIVNADLQGAAQGQTFGISLGAINVARGIADIGSPGENCVKYVGNPPTAVAIDSAFGDWQSPAPQADAAGDVNSTNLDLTATSKRRTAESMQFYLQVNGEALGGAAIPWKNKLRLATHPPAIPPEPDTDRDTMNDSVDPYPYDFNNDGTNDELESRDVDSDSVLDYPFGPDRWLNCTIPGGAQFPSGYRNRTVSVYIGPQVPPTPGPVKTPKPLTGEDEMRVFIDSDGNSSTGHNVCGLGAEYMVNVSGKFGAIAQKGIWRFAGQGRGEWNWTLESPYVSIGKDFSQVELLVPAAGLSLSANATVAFQTKGWDEGTDETQAFALLGAGSQAGRQYSKIPRNEISAYAGKFILLFDTATPFGWTHLAEMDGAFPRGASAYGSSITSTPHGHTGSVTGIPDPAGGTNTKTTGGTVVVCAEAQTHSTATSTLTVTNALLMPAYKELNFCYYGTGGLPSTIPAGAIAMFESVPSGWTQYGALDNRFPIGDLDTFNSGGGSHTHAFTGTITGSTQPVSLTTKTDIYPASNGHTHTFSGTSGSSSITDMPPYMKIIYAKADTEKSYIPTGLIGIFSETPPSTWSRVSALDNLFPYGSTTYDATPVSPSAHGHNFPGATSSTPSGTTGVSSGTATSRYATGTHQHSVGGSIANSAGTELPPYRNVIFAKYNFWPSTWTSIQGGDGGDVANTAADIVSLSYNSDGTIFMYYRMELTSAPSLSSYTYSIYIDKDNMNTVYDYEIHNYNSGTMYMHGWGGSAWGSATSYTIDSTGGDSGDMRVTGNYVEFAIAKSLIGSNSPTTVHGSTDDGINVDLSANAENVPTLGTPIWYDILITPELSDYVVAAIPLFIPLILSLVSTKGRALKILKNARLRLAHKHSHHPSVTNAP